MIEDLTPERLREIGFNDETIKRLETWEDENYNVNLIGVEIFYASRKEKKIYSGIHAGRQIYFRDEERPTFPEGCLDLYPDYYKLALAKYLKTRKEEGQSLYQEAREIKDFHLDQVKAMKKVIKDTKALKREADSLLITNSLSNKIVRYDIVLKFLESMPVVGVASASEIKLGAPVNESKPAKRIPAKALTYEDLFFNAEDAERSLDLLKDLTPPFIGIDNLWIGDSKGIWRLWLDILRKDGIIKPNIPNTAISEILNTKIIGLSLGPTELGKPYKRLKREQITKDIKLLRSQYSQYSRD